MFKITDVDLKERSFSMASKKSKIEFKGTKLQKICLLLQWVIIILMIICARYGSANNIETGFVNSINKYGLYIVKFM